MKKQSLLLLGLIILSIRTYSQRTIDTLDIVINAKIFFLNQEELFYTDSQVFYFLSDTTNYEVLSSKGFNDEIIFIKIKTRGNFQEVRNEVILDSLYQKNKVPFSCDYVLGCKLNAKQFFRLKGFVENDFKLVFKQKYSAKDKDVFLNQFWINEIDIACLFDYYFNNKRQQPISPCMQPCKERDKSFINIKS